ncbi:MAG: ROK family protein, partial [Actinobacteria bacterium]|nr:ROK family protein [Actinomycetota bacterium]
VLRCRADVATCIVEATKEGPVAEPLQWWHQGFDDILKTLEEGSRNKISRERIADVLTRLMIASPQWPSQAEIAQGTMLPLPYRVAADSVSRGVATLAADQIRFVTIHKARAERPGRPYSPLQLGSDQWAMVGVKIGHKAGHSVSLNVVVTGLDGRPVEVPEQGEDCVHIRQIAEDDDLVERLAEVIIHLCTRPALRNRYILGVGVELAGHVFEGEVVEASHNSMRGVALGWQLSRQLDALGHRLYRLIGRHDPMPVIVDNDVNVLAVLQTYRPDFPEKDLALVAVFDDGIGSAPIIAGTVYRGGHGMAGEIGHCLVPVDAAGPNYTSAGETPSPVRGPDVLPTFSDPCHCGRDRHLDCYATPVRIMGELGERDFTEDAFEAIAHRDAYVDGELTQEGEVFQRAGQALGMGIASNLINSINPARVLLILPRALVDYPLNSAAEVYRRSMDDTIGLHAFSHAAKYTQITAQPLSGEQRRFLGAQAAAIRVLDGLVEHAKRRCNCYVPKPRASDPYADEVDATPTTESLWA